MKIKGIPQGIARWFQNLSLSGKIILLICVAGLLPLGLVLTLSVAELKSQSEERLKYAMNQGYNQVKQVVEDKLLRVHNISTLLAMSDMVNANLMITEEERSLAEQLAGFENINSYAYSVEMTSDADDIFFYINEKFPVVTSQSGRYRSISQAEEMPWYTALLENGGRPTWIPFREDEKDSDGYVAIVRQLWNPSDYSEAIGILSISLERQQLDSILVAASVGEQLYLETASGEVLSSNVTESELVRLPLEQRTVGDQKFRRVRIDHDEYMVRSILLSRANLYLVSVMPVKFMEQEIVGVNHRIQIMYMLICLFVALCCIPLTRNLTARIQILKEQMLQVKGGVLGKIAVEREYADEIGQLVKYYNGMVEKVEVLMQEQYALGQEKTGAELKALQSQINPHFLYNTLDMINWMAQKNETDNIKSVVQAMSKFYRLTLSKGRDVISIGEEIRMCDAYMEIQKRRYKGRIMYEVEVEDEIMDCMIPKITLQPFLENAIIHGINEKEDARGVVIVNGWMEDGRITLSVTDDGVGMMEEDKKQSSTGSHYGMENLAKRLKLFYGEDIPIEIESSPGVGTCVIINVPVRRDVEA